MVFVGTILYAVLWIFIALMFVRFVVDWVQVFARQWSPSGPLLVVLEGVYTATDPPIKAVRRWVPSIRLGSVALDLSFMIVLITAWLLLTVVQIVFLS
ncbi:YggT family protein [Nocardioides campestrisoli]|uniref:YggT family protein n=1 Tax=Nocardioides campestrisoli TaxID=2736757 RepID=UPI0015E7DA43|nr:YggT family protein [Nocardioides campestrisoli]